ncbi:GNAT family N-acetyltransferase [Pseudalkalibacillus hwajinpoensis]|uniref:GNAT family N-acetyltransferase n=1 Tax=Guptibacillus hwajinpoensis TaxID=208199 RepID=UPI00325C2F05
MKQIQLREFKKEDWRAVHAYASLERVCKYQPWGPNTVEDSKAYVNGIIKDANMIPRSRFAYAILKDDAVIGACEVNIRDQFNQNGEIAYILHPDWWGLGIASETARMLLSFSFGELHLHRVSGTCDIGNIPSRRVMEKAGMNGEGLLRENLKMPDGWRDSLLFSILDRDWQQQN